MERAFAAYFGDLVSEWDPCCDDDDDGKVRFLWDERSALTTWWSPAVSAPRAPSGLACALSWTVSSNQRAMRRCI